MDVTKILIEGSVFAILSLVIILLVGRRDSAADGHLKNALVAAQANCQQTLQIAVANTAALTKMTETLEQLADAVHSSAEISRASAETVRDLVKILKNRGCPR